MIHKSLFAFIFAFMALLTTNLKAGETHSFKCKRQIGTEASHILNELIDKEVLFGFQDGSIYQVTFDTNELDITTAVYADRAGKIIYQNMELWDCANADQHFLALYKDKISPIGTYKYAAWVLIGNDEQNYISYSDLRWGYFLTPKVVIKKL